MRTIHTLHLAQGTLLATLVSVAGIAPRAASFLLFAVAALFLAEDAVAGRRPDIAALTGPAPLAGLALVGYALVTLAWSADPAAGLEMIGFASLLIVTTVYLAGRLAGAEGPLRRNYLRGAVIGGLLAVGYLSFELVFGKPITEAALNLFFDTIPAKHKGLDVVDGRIVEVFGYYFNRHAGALALYIAPLMALISRYLPPTTRRPVIAVAIILAGLAIFLSESETAKVALIAAGLVWAIARTSRRLARNLLAGAMLAAIVFALPAVWTMHHLGLQDARWLNYTARSRVQIWDYNREETLKHPVFGAGLRTTRALMKRLLARTSDPHTLDQARRPGWHAHNMYLQAWFELGAVGALLSALFGIAMIRAAGRFPAGIAPFALALAGAGMAVAAFGWGMWQTWLMSTYATAICLIYLAAGPPGAVSHQPSS